MNLQYYNPTRMIAREGAVQASADALAALGTRCLVVTGHSSAKLSGALDDVTAVLDKAGIPWQVYDKIGQNPLISVCHQGGAAARAFGADFLIGIGGGSPLDAAKAVAVYAANPELDAAGIYTGWQTPALPFALVGTTAGTGREVTPYAVLTVDESGQKRSVSGPDLFAAAALGDAKKYTATLSRDFTVSTALDALCHAVESHFSQRADPLSRGFSLPAMELLLPNLEALTTPDVLPDGQGREELYYASILAGLAITQTGTCFCHTMGYVLSEEYGVPHGVACAVFLGEYLAVCEREVEPQVFGDFMDFLGTSMDEITDLVARLVKTELPVLDDGRIEELLDRWHGVSNMRNTPGRFDRDRQREVAKRILQGGSQ